MGVKTMESLRKKLNSNRGESLAEVMVAALIGGFAMLLLASMLMGASRLVQRGETSMNEFYQGMSDLDSFRAADGEEGIQGNITITPQTPVDAQGVSLVDGNGSLLTIPEMTGSVRLFHDSQAVLTAYERQ